MRFAIIFLALQCFALPSFAQQQLKNILQPIVDAHDGTVAVSVRHLHTGESFSFNGDKPMPTASLIKFPVMIAMFDAIERGEADLATPIVLKDDDMVPGSGIITGNFSAGMQLSLKDAMRLMIIHSDNTATNLVVDQIGGLPVTAKLMEQMGCPNTKLHAKVYRRDTSIFPERSKEFGLGSTTANEMVALLTKLNAGELVSAEASNQMFKVMLECNDRTKIVRELPKATKFAHKTGAVSNSRTDAGIISTANGPIAICVLTTDNRDRSWSNDNAALVTSGKIGRAVYDYFNPAGESEEPGSKNLKIGADGELVETLQRTLNARTKPSVNLGVDGDFGPATQGGVKAFQQQAGLPVTGEVDAATWEALGTLITEDAPVAEPSVINNEVLAREKPMTLDGAPRVTCKAWAIGDAETGELLWGMNEAEKLHPASTTKIMTGYLVAKIAKADPSVWEEVVTFSTRADETIGSSARLKAGEQLPVSELLYGLLLPSGNDASVALAEHFGSRAVEEVPPDLPSDSYQQFVATMNVAAGELGMEETSYDNTHGLTSENHLTSARDLLKLAYAAMDMEEFRKRTNTRQRGCTVVSEAGYKRNVLWNNTNRLLKIEGYDGVKTGTTSAAGCCLVSRGHRDGKGLIVVVLGSVTSDARYVDSENLFQWAWRQQE